MFRPRFALALGLALLVLTACQDDSTRIAEHRERGDAYIANEEYAEAILEFKNVLKLDPNDAAAHYGLATAYLAQQDPRRAYWELEETARLDPENVDARLQLGQFLLFQKDEDKERVIASADEILALEPDRWEAMILKGRALVALGRLEESGDSFEAAIEAAPDQSGPRLMYANYLRATGDLEAAEASFLKLTELEEGFAAWAAYAGFLASSGDRDADAEAAYRTGLEQAEAEERIAATSVLANFLIARDRGDEAEAVLKEGIGAGTDDPRLVYLLARLYHTQGRTAEADQMILEATRANPQDPGPFLLLSSYRERIGDLEGALEAAEDALKADPDNELAQLRRAEVLVDLGYRGDDTRRVAQGRAIVDAILSKNATHPEALFVKAKIDLAESQRGEEAKLEAAITALRRSIDSRPDWAQAHFLLASALFIDGDRAQARASAARALELDASLLPARILMARIHAALGDHSLAVEAGKRALEQSDNPQLRIIVAQSLVRQGQLGAALAELEAIPEEDRGAEAHYAIGRVLMLKGEGQSARVHLVRALEIEPAHAEILRSMLSLDVKNGQLEESAQRVSIALGEDPDNPKLHQLAGEIALFMGKPSEAEKSFRRAIEIDPNDLRSYDLLARYLAVSSRPDEVLATYERALEQNDRSGPLNLVVGSLYEAQGRRDEAMERYERAIELDPDLAVAKNNLAYLIAEGGGNLDRALDLAQEANALLPDNPNAADTLGWVLYKKDVPSAAVSYLRESVNGMAPDDRNLPLVRQHLAMAYEANGQEELARAELVKALEEIELMLAPQEDRPRGVEPPHAQEIRDQLARLEGA
jgi:uncharacterized protein (TIGR02996 family)